MPHSSKLTRSKAIHDAYSVASISVLDFLVPAVHGHTIHAKQKTREYGPSAREPTKSQHGRLESFFFTALSQAPLCAASQYNHGNTQRRRDPRFHKHRAGFSTSVTIHQDVKEDELLRPTRRARKKDTHDGMHSHLNVRADAAFVHGGQQIPSNDFPEGTTTFKAFYNEKQSSAPQRAYLPPDFFNDHFERRFAEGSHLPPTFYDDVNFIRNMVSPLAPKSADKKSSDQDTVYKDTESDSLVLFNESAPDRLTADVSVISHDVSNASHDGNINTSFVPAVEQQMRLLQSVRELEEKLAKAKQDLHSTMIEQVQKTKSECGATSRKLGSPPIILSKEDYINLVDLYYYSHNSRFSPEATDMSPTPTFLDDHSFKISEDFSEAAAEGEAVNEDEDYVSPLKHIEEMLKAGKLREIAVMQIFIDLLLQENSSNRALYEAYKNLPEPGVAHLPKGVLRLFLQRMSTPYTHSEKSMLRYLSLIDDMQQAKIPITKSEWSSAVYLAGRSFSRVTDSDVGASFRIWQQMEMDAGVKSSHVTFNILFDVAVRAGKFALGQTVLMEMTKRNLRLNRLGRVSLIYYHGLRGDGDGVRKTYRDFVEAGEIVDTLVLNCVIAALLNAQEPTAAEQVYERMKSLQMRLRRGVAEDDLGGESYIRYPPPGDSQIDCDMASNSLGRILLKARHLRDMLPEHHQKLQAIMPLTPDIKTFSTMIAYHATKSGDLDRISVILNEMTGDFDIPLEPLIFQLLFKGFALHGPTGGPDSPWSIRRLELSWNACRSAIKDSNAFMSTQETTSPPSPSSTPPTQPTLPSITEINALSPSAPLPPFQPALHNPPPRRLSAWNEFILDLAAFPRQRLKRIERFHAQMFDDDSIPKPHESRLPHTFENPFFQSTVYTAPEPALDTEEGEYVLPNPAETTLLQPQTNSSTFDQEFDQEDARESGLGPKQVRGKLAATRPLVCWLLRAYARNTHSRTKVEEIWGSVRKIWKPRDELERESVVRVLRRCLRDCDREGGD